MRTLHTNLRNAPVSGLRVLGEAPILPSSCGCWPPANTRSPSQTPERCPFVPLHPTSPFPRSPAAISCPFSQSFEMTAWAAWKKKLNPWIFAAGGNKARPPWSLISLLMGNPCLSWSQRGDGSQHGCRTARWRDALDIPAPTVPGRGRTQPPTHVGSVPGLRSPSVPSRPNVMNSQQLPSQQAIKSKP